MTDAAPDATTGPRRRAVTRRRPAGTLLPAAAAVSAAVLALTLVELTTHDDVAEAGATRVGVTDLTQVCLPDTSPGRPPDTEVTTVSAALGDLDDTGEVRVSVGASQAGPVSTRRGEVRRLAEAAPREVTLVAAEGAAAAGRVTHRTDSGAGTLAVQECVQPRTRWWFTGAGAGLEHRSQLVLANVDDGPAVVDLRFYGPDGAVESVGTRGMSMAPGEVRTLDLVDVAPQAEELAVHVETSRGRVAAAVTDSFATAPGATPGRDWLPAQDRPSRRLRLGGVPTRAGARTLVLANPSGREALVELSVAGESGTFVPTGASQVSVPPATVVSVDVTGAWGEDASAAVLTSTAPVTATLRSTGGASAGGDVSYAGALAPLSGPAAVPALVGGALHLTAGPGGAEVTVAALDEDGAAVSEAELAVQAGATARWPLPRGAAYVVVTPRRGRAVGGVVTSRTDGMAQVGLSPVALTLSRPRVTSAVRPRVG